MGDGLVGPGPYDAKSIAESLTRMFDKGIDETKKRFAALTQPDVFPYLMQYSKNDPPSRGERQRSLRFAGSLLTGDILFTHTTNKYPADQLRAWLKWLSWLHYDPDKVAVFIGLDRSGKLAPSNDPPAKAIMDTLYTALTNDNITVKFKWHQDRNIKNTKIEIQRTNSPFVIEVTSPHVNDISLKEKDEDVFPD
jgi:hypothetical protein